MDIKVAERIAELMRDEGINQVQLAAKIGVKQNTVSSWVLGKKEPTISSLWRLAGLFRGGYRLFGWQKTLLSEPFRRLMFFCGYRLDSNNY